MDLEPLPPEGATPTADATPTAPEAIGAGPVPTDPADAPRPPWSPAPWQPSTWTSGDAGWATAGSATADGPADRLGMSRSTKIVGGAVAVALVAAGAWAAGTALHSSTPSVRFQPAASTAAASGGTTGGSGAAPTGPARRRGMFGGGGGGGGVVTAVSATDITVNAPTRPTKPTTPGAAPVTPATPTTKSVTIKVTGTTTYVITEPGASGDITTGMRIAATGSVNADGSLAATSVELVQAGIGLAGPGAGKAARPPAAPGSTTAPAKPNLPANPPFALGTVKSVTAGSGGNVTVVVSSQRGDRTVDVTSTTTITKTVKASLGDVKVGDTVLTRGTPATDGSVTATTVQIVSAGLKGRGRFGVGIGPGFGFGPGFGPGFGFGLGGRGHRFGGPGGPGGPPGAGQTGSTAASPI
jgi:Domain of unknown function (DUF5666)